MPHILILNGSPSAKSRTGRLLDHWAEQPSLDGWSVKQNALRTLPAQALLSADFNELPLVSARLAVEEADASMAAIPVYKGAYTGLLKAFIDVLHHLARVDKSVLPIANGGTLAHYGVIGYALQPIDSFFGILKLVTFSLMQKLVSCMPKEAVDPAWLSLERARITL